MDFGYGDFTLETRIRLKSLTVGRILSRQRIDVADYAVSLQLTSSGQVQLLLRTASIALAVYTSTTALTVGQWAHIAAVRRNGTTTLYINGVPQASSTVAYTLTDNQTTLSIGKYGSTSGHVFNMEEFRVTQAARYFGSFVAPERAMPTKG